MMDHRILFDILYAQAAAGERRQRLFGSCLSSARAAFARSLAGSAFPEVWFEVPLLGEPRFDLHVLISHDQLDTAADSLPKKAGIFEETFSWFAGRKHGVRQLALSWDLKPDEIAEPAIQLLVSERNPEIVAGFLQAAGRADGIAAYKTFSSRLPEGWFACYSGVFPGRPGAGVRVECIPDKTLQSAYAEDPELLRQHLARTGFTAFGDTLLPRCRQFAQTPFDLEFQFDIGTDGTPGPVLGASLRFACPPGEADWQCFDANGEAGVLMRLIEKWGLADDRWRLLNDTMFATRIKHGGEQCRLFCFTAFVKHRWRSGEPLDAKTYLMAGTY